MLGRSKPGALPCGECGVEDVDTRRYWLCHALGGDIRCCAGEYDCGVLECFGTVQANASARRSIELHANECRKRNIINGYRVQLQVERPLCRWQHESEMARLPVFKQDTLKFDDLSHKLTTHSAAPSLSQEIPIVENRGRRFGSADPSTYRSTSI